MHERLEALVLAQRGQVLVGRHPCAILEPGGDRPLERVDRVAARPDAGLRTGEVVPVEGTRRCRLRRDAERDPRAQVILLRHELARHVEAGLAGERLEQPAAHDALVAVRSRLLPQVVDPHRGTEGGGGERRIDAEELRVGVPELAQPVVLVAVPV